MTITTTQLLKKLNSMFKDISTKIFDISRNNGHEIIVNKETSEYLAIIAIDLDAVLLYFGKPGDDIIANMQRFENMRCIIQYLRLIKFDSAVNYDMIPYCEEILSALYLTKLVTANDILGKCY